MAGIYIHIPFCKKKCHYCDFYKTLDTGLADLYTEALLKEIDIRKDYLSTTELVETIYFGGGTPSVLSLKNTRKILNSIKDNFNLAKSPEVTMELNPDDVNRVFLNGIAREGVNRLSIGLQSWSDPILEMLNRRHNASDAARSINLARDSGFNNISVDLIYGIPGQDHQEWEENLKKTFDLDVEHISAYHLTIEENTIFGKMKKQGSLKEIEEEESEKQFNTLTTLAAQRGYQHYEISNLAKEGHYSKHNTNYWRQVNYLGLGPSAHSYNGYSRQWNIANLSQYIALIGKGKDCFEMESIDEKTRFNEYVMTTLRTMWGIDMGYLETSFNKEMHDYLLNLASRFIKYGMIERTKENNLALTAQGKMISDNIISELIMP